MGTSTKGSRTNCSSAKSRAATGPAQRPLPGDFLRCSVVFQPRSSRLLLLAAIGSATLSSAAVSPVVAAPLTSARVLRIVDGNQVFIDANQARINQTAGQGSLLSTRQSRAELLFNTRAIGLLGRSSAIRIGARCFRLDSGVVVVNGSQQACLGSRILGVRGTTYVLARESDATYTLSVLAGESVIGQDLPELPQEADILSRYPRIQPSLGVQAGGLGRVFPGGGASFNGGLQYFAPLSQSSARRVLYSYSSLGSSFQNLWGASTEIGYRWFTPANRSTSGAYIGYAGYSSPGCFSHLLNAGLQWERSRWRLGASGGIRLNDCPAGLHYGALNLSIPVGRVKEQPIYVSISPYVLAGNVVGSSLLTSSSTSAFPGIRTSLELPIRPHLSLRGHAGADTVYGVTVGGYFTYRIPATGQIYTDPNSPAPAAAAAVSSAATVTPVATPIVTPIATPIAEHTSAQQIVAQRIGTQPSAAQHTVAQHTAAEHTGSQHPGARTASELAQLALAGTAVVVADLPSPLGIDARDQAQQLQPGVIGEGQRGRFSADGELLAVEPISNSEFLQLLRTNLNGHNPLPESRRIARTAQGRGLFNNELAGFLGIDFLHNATLAVSTTVDTPFSPLTQMPVGSYICAATSQARQIGAQLAGPGQFNYSGGPAYFGRGSQTYQGYPATSNRAQAYVFSDPGVCRELNRLANQGYDVVQAEPIGSGRPPGTQSADQSGPLPGSLSGSL